MRIPVNIRYYHKTLQIGLEDIRNAWLVSGKEPVKLKTIVYQGQLYYRLPLSGKRISYRELKKGLIKKQLTIYQVYYPLPF